MTVIATITKSKILHNKGLIFGAVICALLFVIATTLAVVIIRLNKAHHQFDHHWNYHEQDKWPGLCNSGQSQSPIALSVLSANLTESQSLNFEYGNIENVEITNNGHSVAIHLNTYTGSKPKLSGGGLKGNFTLNHFHFHWPSEHIIDGKQYKLESHFVFISDGYNNNLEAALEVPFAVTVVAIMYEESENTKHKNFQIINEAVQKVSKEPGETFATSETININDFIPENDKRFFKYDGSLTTPDCNENINWLVFKIPSSITKEEIQELTNIYTEDGELLEYNNRNLQNINQRTIFLMQSSA